MPGIDGETKVALGGAINAAWGKLADKVADEFAKSGVDKEQITFKPAIRMQYYGQLNDLEFRSPVSRVEEPSDIDQLTNAFEELYAKIYHNAARTPDFGYLATRAIMTGSIAVEKPVLPQEALAGEEPPAAARKGERKVYWQGSWQAANIYELERLQAGNKISGPAIIEAPACTVVVPPQRSVRLDEQRIFHMV
jgi:N-methylhydantoinase A/oxoprolinase/acetone carboxylase beta subunit